MHGLKFPKQWHKLVVSNQFHLYNVPCGYVCSYVCDSFNEIVVLLDDMYTPAYCQKRCTSLRDQYNREKRKIATESKSGSAAAKTVRFPFFSQLTFLDHVIKKRR